MKLVRRSLNLLETVTEIWSGASVLLITGLMVAAVVLRYTMEGSIVGSWTIMTGLMVWLIFALIGSVSRKDEHIKIGVLAEMVFRKRARAFRSTLENIVALPLCAYLTWAGWHWVDFRLQQGGREFFSSTVTYADWIPILILPIGFGIATLFYLERLVKQVSSYLRQRRQRQYAQASVSGQAEEGAIEAAQGS